MGCEDFLGRAMAEGGAPLDISELGGSQLVVERLGRVRLQIVMAVMVLGVPSTSRPTL